MCSLSRTTDLMHRTDRRAKILTKEKIQAGIAQINSCYIWEKAGGIQNPLVYSMRTLSSSSSNWVRATWKRKSNTKFSSVAQSCPTPWPHGLQHARPPCPSPAHRDYPNSSPLSQWCHPNILSFVTPFSSCPKSLPASGSFAMSQVFTSGGRVLEFQLQYQSFQWSLRTDLL